VQDNPIDIGSQIELARDQLAAIADPVSPDE
jgi:hypothetical protein